MNIPKVKYFGGRIPHIKNIKENMEVCF